MDTAATIIGYVSAIFALMFGLIIIGGLLLTWAWNVVIPQTFGLPQIDAIQGIALNVLGWSIFKNFNYTKNK